MKIIIIYENKKKVTTIFIQIYPLNLLYLILI